VNETFPIKQTKFSNGEIHPMLYGDTSHPKYAASLRTCLNWIPVPQGALVKRPGFKFIAPVKDSSYAPRLIQYTFSDDQTFVLEVGNLYIRFYQRGRYVGVDGNLHTYGDSYAGGYYEVVTPFTTAMLPFLKFSSVGNVITIAYGGQAAGVAGIAPRDLTHTQGALTPWTISVTNLKAPVGAVTWTAAMLDAIQPYAPAGVYNSGQLTTTTAGGTTLEWAAIQNGITGAGQAPPNPPGVLNAAQTGLQGNLFWTPSTDTVHPGLDFGWVETVVFQDAQGVTYESAPSPELTLHAPLSTDRPRVFVRATYTLAGGYTALYMRVYRRTKNGSFGWVLDHVFTTPFQDDGRAANYAIQPPAGTDPFLVNGVDSFPSVIGYLDQRRLWAGSALLPSSLFLSKIGDLYNYDNKNTPGADTDAMNLTLASEVLEQIRSFVPMRRGLLLTGQGEWAIAGQGGAPISRSNNDPKRQSKWGSSWRDPIVIGTGILFNTAKSNMVRDLYPLYGLYADIWDGQDLSVMARHLLDLHTIQDWAFQSTPYPVVWLVREDGYLLSLTYQHAPPSFGQQLSEGIVAWAQHTTGVGSDKFESVCCVPEPPEDAVYVGVRRFVNGGFLRNIERMDSPICPASPYTPGFSDVRYGRFLDASLTYDGHNTTGTNATIDSVTNPGSNNIADYAAGKLVKVTTVTTPFVVADAANPYGSAFVFDPENLLGFNVSAAVSGRIVGFTSSTVVTIELDAPMTQAQVNIWRAGQNAWALAKGQITLTHLLNYQWDSGDANLARGIITLADGDVQVPGAWVGGVVYLNTPAVVIHAGISYNGDVALLDAYHPNAEIRNKFKEVLRVGFEVANTRDMWAGKDFANLAQLQERTVLDAYSVMGLHTGYFETFVTGGWNKAGAACLRHFQPLPATLSSVLREMRLGDS